MKKKLYLCLAAVIFLLWGCAPITNDESSSQQEPVEEILYEEEREFLTFDEAIERSTDVVVAEFVKERTQSGCKEQEFRIKKMLKGATTASTIYVYTTPAYVTLENTDITYTSGKNVYEAKSEYLLVLERHVSVYTDHDRYLLFGDIYMPMKQLEESKMYGQPLSDNATLSAITSSTDTLKYIETLAADSADSVPFYGSDYVRSDDFGEIAEGATHILRVKVNSLLSKGADGDRETYRCSVKECLKGSVADNNIFVVFFPEQAVEGEEYIVLVNRSGDETSLVFSLAAKQNSVIAADDAESVAAVSALSEQY